jgi:hypothetical protein
VDETAVDAVRYRSEPSVDTRPRAARASTFASALRTLASRQDVDETLQLAVDMATELVRGCDSADVMFIRPGGTTTPVSTDPLAVAADRAQDEAGEGPCMSAARGDGAVVLANDLRADDRWPAFASRASELGIGSAVSYQLYLERSDDDRFGALNLYGRDVDAFDRRAVDLGEVFAVHCSTVLAAAISREGAKTALDSRDVIGQAKGILMARHRITAQEAFDHLRRASQDRNVKLRDLAAQVVRDGSLG